MRTTHNRQCSGPWPALPYEEWSTTLKTLHMWTQIVGKIRLRMMPWQNHSWHSTLYITARGLTTGSMPYGHGILEIEFDFENHHLILRSTFEQDVIIELYPRSVASFFKELLSALRKLEIDISIHEAPNEVEDSILFAENEQDASYDQAKVADFWQAAVNIHNVFLRFRSGFVGKSSPVHFFWGAFDIALTRFSGKRAPLHHGKAPNMPKEVMQEAYSREVSSCGFWPGGDNFPQPVFYAYCYPTSDSYSRQEVKPAEAFYSNELGEFFLPYDTVRLAEHPEAMLMDFLESMYQAAARSLQWEQADLEQSL